MAEMLNLSKGDDLVLEKDGQSLQRVVFGIGWDAPEGGATFDLDSSVAVFNGSARQGVCYYGNIKSHGLSGVTHSGDDLTGGSSADGPDEEISVDLTQLSGDRAAFMLTLYNAESKRQNLSQARNAFVEVRNQDTGEKLARFNVTGSDMSGAAMHFADIKKDSSGKWHFTPVGRSLGMADLNSALNQI